MGALRLLQSMRTMTRTSPGSPRFTASPAKQPFSAVRTVSAKAAPSHFDVGDGAVLPVPEDVAPLFVPYSLSHGRFQLSNRLVYAPLTRMRAIDTIPQPSAATYYGQRTVPGGLLISEATNISAEALGYMNSPGLWLPDQLEAWKSVVKAVHDKGGLFFSQLWHCGRASHNDLQPGGAAPLSSSTRRISSPEFEVYTPKGPQPYPTPRAATQDDIKRVVGDYARAARNAVEVAGFDGVEIHGANGYLIDQFIKDSVNDRTDEYGGSIENRARFCLEVVDAVCAAVGAERVGIRLSPFTGFLDAADSTPYATHAYIVEKLNAKGLAYVHMIEPRVQGVIDVEHPADTLEPFRRIYRGTFIAAGGYKADNAAAAVAAGHAELVAIGRWYLANPDLHKRFLLHGPLNKYDRNTFYTPGMEGYLDYPTLEQVQAKEKEKAGDMAEGQKEAATVVTA